MEKIYMDDNNSPKKQGNGQYHFSIVLSFAVAIFAIVSLIAVGFNQVSYAAPNDVYNDATDDVDNEDTSFTLYPLKKKDTSSVYYDQHLRAINPSDSNSYFQYTMMFSGKNGENFFTENDLSSLDKRLNIVFCVDNQIDDPGYTKLYSANDSVLSEEQLAKVRNILNQSGLFDSSKSISGLTNDGSAMFYQVEAYATQAAIWVALDKQGISGGSAVGSPSSLVSDLIKNKTKFQLYFVNTSGGDTPYHANGNPVLANNVVENVMAVVNNASDGSGYFNSLSVNLEDEVSEVDGKEEYQSSLVSVSGEGLLSYSLTLSGVDGLYVIDENGNTIDNLEDIDASMKFYVRFPKSNLTEDTTNIVISATGKFNSFEPTIYSSGDYQKVVKLTTKTVSKDASNTLTVVKAPDTASSVSQTIYFIGLVVLLCGVGIIYANSKAIKNS